MRVLIIGGTRFIGPFVVRSLLAQGAEVAVVHRGLTRSKFLPEVRAITDASLKLPITRLPREALDYQPDVVVHMIGIGESDARAAVEAFAGNTGRLVAISSGDVYRAYGRFACLEPGPVDNSLLTEEAPLRTVFYPYRKPDTAPDAMEYWYEKIRWEQVIQTAPDLPSTILRLPKVYGEEENAELFTVYLGREHPRWRWTHGYVENVAAAIALAAVRPAASGRIYNVGEADTPTTAERLDRLPPPVPPEILSGEVSLPPHDFAHDIAYDTSRIRRELGYREPFDEPEMMRRTVERARQA